MTLGIGDNGSGECIALEKCINAKTRVILSSFIDLDKQYHIEIGSSFTDFLDGERWFSEE